MTRLIALCLASMLVLVVGARADTRQRTLTIDGLERTYLLVNGQEGRPRSLIVALHGNWGTGAQFAEYGQWEVLARKHDITVALPDGLNRAWNDGRPSEQMSGRKPRPGVDDVKFLSELVSQLVEKTIAAKSRVFVTGISNGGMMTLRMLCDRADLFAGGAAVIATMPVTSVPKCKPSRPLPVMILNGTEDRFVPYEGSDVFTATEKTAAFWRARNGCTDQAQRTWLPDRDPEDGSKVERISYACPPSAPVVVYRVDGGGHQMPSFSRRLALEAVLGRRNHDVEGAEEIWAFFSRLGN